MNATHIDHVIELFKNRQDVEKEAHLASFEEIKENDFNLNIPRYVDTNEDEIPVNLADVNTELNKIDGEIESVQNEFLSTLKSLKTDDKNMQTAVYEFIKLVEGF